MYDFLNSIILKICKGVGCLRIRRGGVQEHSQGQRNLGSDLVPWVSDDTFRFPLKTMASRISTRYASSRVAKGSQYA